MKIQPIKIHTTPADKEQRLCRLIHWHEEFENFISTGIYKTYQELHANELIEIAS